MLETLSSFSFLEWLGLITGIVYVILSARNRIECWYFGIVSSVCIAYHDFFGGLNLYSDGVLQLFYIGIGMLGLYRWKNLELSFHSNLRTHMFAILGSIVLSFLYGLLMSKLTTASYPWVDAFTTVFSVLATLFLVNRQLSAWIYFVIIDTIMAYLYFSRGWDLYALLFVIYTLVAIYAVWNWRQLFRFNLNSN